MSTTSEGCGGAVCRCLASIPCTVLCMFLAFFGAVLACGSSLIVAFHRTRGILNQPSLWPWFMYICLGIGIGMLVLVTIFLIIATLSSKHNAESLFDGSGPRLRCMRGFNVLVLVLMVLMLFAWLLITVALSVAVLYLILVDHMANKPSTKCINLAHYGIPKVPKQVMCHEEVVEFVDEIKKEELLICYGVSLVMAVIIFISLILFMINAASNYAHLGAQCARSTTSRIGGNDVTTSSHVPIGSYHSYDGRPLATETAM